MRCAARLVGQERGSAAVVIVLCLTVLAGFMGLVLDAGMMFYDRTQLQKAVDAAALAGAKQIGSSGSSSSAALTYAGYNGVQASEVTYNAPAPAGAGVPYPSWTVGARRGAHLQFAPLVGFTQAGVAATATAINSPVSTIDGSYVLPYAVWAGNSSGTYSPAGLQSQEIVLYRDNQWPSQVVSPDPNKCKNDKPPDCNPNWDVGPQVDFKGYFNHMQPSALTVGQSYPLYSKGGNASEPIDLICQLAGSGHPAVLPVVNHATESSGTITFSILTFIALDLNSIPGCSGGKAMGTSFTGQTDPGATISGGRPGGPGVAGAVHVLMLWQ